MSIVANEIMTLFQQYGTLTYGEECTVLEHSVQSGLIAREKGLDTELVLSAFLHDIGHLIPAPAGGKTQKMGTFGIQSHEDIGAYWLERKGFSERVTIPIRYHVAAKRYLCSVDTGYWEHLSLPSQETLVMQGGSMTEDEVIAFEAIPLHEECVLIREIDDEAKAKDFTVLPDHLNYFGSLLLVTL